MQLGLFWDQKVKATYCNIIDRHKLVPLIINKWQTPRSLKHIDKTSLPVYYFWNKNAWMQRSMQQSGRHIILLTDNASCHSIDIIDSLSNVRVYFLPQTPLLMDAGIIYSFKVVQN